MAYYLEGVDWTARQATETTTKLLELFRVDRGRVISSTRAPATLRVYEEIQRRVFISIRRLSEGLNVSTPTVITALRRLEELNIVRETTGRKYGRMFAYQKQLEILNETGT